MSLQAGARYQVQLQEFSGVTERPFRTSFSNRNVCLFVDGKCFVLHVHTQTSHITSVYPTNKEVSVYPAGQKVSVLGNYHRRGPTVYVQVAYTAGDP